MEKVKYNLLVDPIFSVSLIDNSMVRRSLPSVLSLMCQDKIQTFLAAQPHQTHALAAFLTQLAFHVLSGQTELEFEEMGDNFWREELLKLTGGKPESWCLIVENLRKLAFMQPPLFHLETVESWKEALFPDLLDSLATSKNHDVKSQKISPLSFEHWAIALIICQTTSGFLGLGNYGVSRMNRGHGSRAFVGFTPSLSFGVCFQRDLRRMLKSAKKVCDDYGYCSKEGIKLLWLEPWDGKSSLRLNQLAPHFIEVCRPIRMEIRNNTLCARTTSSKSPRIVKGEGDVGDPWLPVKKSNSKAISVGSSGFDYRLINDLLLGSQYRVHGEDLKPQKNDVCFYASVLARGQGVTQGFHYRNFRFPEKIAFSFTNNKNIYERSTTRINYVDKFSDALHAALKTLMEGDLHKKSSKSTLSFCRSHIKQFETYVDQVFFEKLWEDYEEDDDNAYRNWNEVLFKKSETILISAQGTFRGNSMLFFKNMVHSNRVFYGLVYKFASHLISTSSKEGSNQ